MRSQARSTPIHSPAPGALPETNTEPTRNGSPAARDADAVAPTQSTDRTTTGTETRRGHFRRKARLTGMHGSAIAAVALVAYLIALAASNTAHVKVDWVFGGSHVSLVWLVLFTAIVGWLLGLATSARFHWRTRAPRPRPPRQGDPS